MTIKNWKDVNLHDISPSNNFDETHLWRKVSVTCPCAFNPADWDFSTTQLPRPRPKVKSVLPIKIKKNKREKIVFKYFEFQIWPQRRKKAPELTVTCSRLAPKAYSSSGTSYMHKHREPSFLNAVEPRTSWGAQINLAVKVQLAPIPGLFFSSSFLGLLLFSVILRIRKQSRK